MNSTIEKFGYPDTLIREYDHWVVLLRPSQVTLGSLILAAKGDFTAYGDLPDGAFAEQSKVVRDIEKSLADFINFEKINYLMLMMVDREVHYHVFPRYGGERTWEELSFPDLGWPRLPDLAAATNLHPGQVKRLTMQLRKTFC